MALEEKHVSVGEAITDLEEKYVSVKFNIYIILQSGEILFSLDA